MVYLNRFIALFGVCISLLVTSCDNERMEEALEPETNDEVKNPQTSDGFFITLTGEVPENKSRVHWDINNDEINSLAFAWDASTDEMRSFVWRDNAFVDFEGSNKYSNTKVTPKETKNQAQLEITTGLSNEYAENDIIWSVSPLKQYGNIDSDNKVTFTLPDGFTQTQLNSTEHLKDYILMSGTGTVTAEKTASIKFNVLPAIVRFKVINDEVEESLTVNEVSLSGAFCDKAELSMSEGKVTTTYSASNGTYAIKVVTSEGLAVAAGETEYLYALVFPTTSTDTENITLSLKGNYGTSSVDLSETRLANVSLVSNTYYDVDVPVSKPVEEPLFSFEEDNNLSTLGYGQSYQIQYKAADGTSIEWSSSIADTDDNNILTVNDNGVINVETITEGSETITATVTKNGKQETFTTQATVVKGRFDCMFDDGLNPWYSVTNGASVNGYTDGKTIINMATLDGPKYRADLQFFNGSNGYTKTYLDAKNYPILAMKIKLPTYNTDGDGAVGNIILEAIQRTSDNNIGGNHDNKYNSHKFVGTEPADGEIAYIYYNLSSKYNFGPSNGRLSLSTDAPTEINKLTFKITDFKNISDTSYDVYWIKSFSSEQELDDFVSNEKLE